MTEEPDEPYVSRLPTHAQREFAEHTIGVLQANRQLQAINAIAEMETNLLNQAGEGQLVSFFHRNVDDCRRIADLWMQIVAHFDGHGPARRPEQLTCATLAMVNRTSRDLFPVRSRNASGPAKTAPDLLEF